MPRTLLFSVTKKDLEITWFSGSGGGGQHRNRHANCCRIRHPDSGALVTGQEQRSRIANQKAALHRLVKHPKFKVWHARRCAEIEEGQTALEAVAEAMRPENLKIEYYPFR